MLVLERLIDERIELTLPDGAKIFIMLVDVRIDARAAKIGIEAPKNVRILRDDAVRTTPKEEGDDTPAAVGY